MAAIFALSAREDLPGLSLPGIDKVAHFAEYALLGALVSRATLGYGLERLRAVAVALGVCAAYAISDELHQAFVPGRATEVLDLVADVLGAGAGAIGWYAAGRRRASASGGSP
ncbi:MAG: VanZ family protein [Myxococcales bacterium]|nr:VanZ family protein [Myxococcales bacterium]